MWKRGLLLLCISSLFLTALGGVLDVTVPADVTEDGLKEVADELVLDELVTEDEATDIEQAPKKVPGRIVNGTKAAYGQFPQQVSLRRRYSQSHFCGGSILTSRWILSAGHCMFDKLGNILEAYTIIVIAGEIVLKNTNAARQWSYVKQLIVHPQFDMETLYNDVALIQMEKQLTFDEYVKPALIPRLAFEPDTMCQVSGWGYPKYEEHIVSGTLMFVDVPLLPISLCRELLVEHSLMPPGTFCAGYVEGGRDACQGDSGGGLVCKGYLTGVVSGGHGCAWPKLPGIYSDVRYYLPWMRKYVNLTESQIVRSRPFNSSASSLMISSSAFAVLAAVLYIDYGV